MIPATRKSWGFGYIKVLSRLCNIDEPLLTSHARILSSPDQRRVATSYSNEFDDSFHERVAKSTLLAEHLMEVLAQICLLTVSPVATLNVTARLSGYQQRIIGGTISTTRAIPFRKQYLFSAFSSLCYWSFLLQ